VEGSCEDGDEPSGSVKCWEAAAQVAASQVGLSSMELVSLASCGLWRLERWSMFKTSGKMMRSKAANIRLLPPSHRNNWKICHIIISHPLLPKESALIKLASKYF
jgi:hypothetical protein